MRGLPEVKKNLILTQLPCHSCYSIPSLPVSELLFAFIDKSKLSLLSLIILAARISVWRRWPITYTDECLKVARNVTFCDKGLILTPWFGSKMDPWYTELGMEMTKFTYFLQLCQRLTFWPKNLATTGFGVPTFPLNGPSKSWLISNQLLHQQRSQR